MGKHTQLDLAVVRVHQHAAGFRNEHLADFRAQIGSNGDVLQIGLRGGQAACGRHQILERGVDTAVGANLFQKPVCIGGFQFRQHPVIHDCRDNGVLAFQLFQHVRIGGVAAFGFLHRREPQLVEEQFPQLFG